MFIFLISIYNINVIDNNYKITGINVHYFNVDCCDNNILRKIFESYNFGAVIHYIYGNLKTIY